MKPLECPARSVRGHWLRTERTSTPLKTKAGGAIRRAPPPAANFGSGILAGIPARPALLAERRQSLLPLGGGALHPTFMRQQRHLPLTEQLAGGRRHAGLGGGLGAGG